MELCSSGHNEVCYECKNCPVCETLAEKEELENEISDLKSEIESFK